MTKSKASNNSACNKPKPKRALSPYNLFYRFKRAKIIEASSNANTKKAVCEIVAALTGLEGYPTNFKSTVAPDQLDEIRRTNIRLILEQQLLAKDTTKRAHRKSSHGFLSFVEMNSIMVDSWKKADKFTKDIFKELAEEGKKVYQQKLVEYNTEMHLKAVKKFNSLNTDQETTDTGKTPSEHLHQASPVCSKSAGPIGEISTSSQFNAWNPPTSFENHMSSSQQPYRFTRRSSRSNATMLSSDVPAPALPELPQIDDMQAVTEDAFEPLVTFDKGQLYQPKQQTSFASTTARHESVASPTYSKPNFLAAHSSPAQEMWNLPPLVTPARKYGNAPTSNDDCAALPHAITPRSSHVSPPPFSTPSWPTQDAVENTTADNNIEDMASFDSNSQEKPGMHKREVSVDDFMDLIACLSED